jgi:hypothetical protein
LEHTFVNRLEPIKHPIQRVLALDKPTAIRAEPFSKRLVLEHRDHVFRQRCGVSWGSQ